MTMTEITTNTTVGELVAERPGRARVFERYGIDYCCGGRQALSEACTAKELDAQEVVGALRDADQQSTPADEPDWTRAQLGALIANILETHHAYLRRELPRLTEIVAKVQAVHGVRHPELTGVRQTFDSLHGELESHMMKEEQVLFPLIREMESAQTLAASRGGSVRNPISVMEHEHESAGAALARLRELTNDYTPPEDGCTTYQAMLHSLAELEADLHRHIHKENNILFPRATELEASLA
jgi:regulator of cell morphogenesis and NO signaling